MTLHRQRPPGHLDPGIVTLRDVLDWWLPLLLDDPAEASRLRDLHDELRRRMIAVRPRPCAWNGPPPSGRPTPSFHRC